MENGYCFGYGQDYYTVSDVTTNVEMTSDKPFLTDYFDSNKTVENFSLSLGFLFQYGGTLVTRNSLQFTVNDYQLFEHGDSST